MSRETQFSHGERVEDPEEVTSARQGRQGFLDSEQVPC